MIVSCYSCSCGLPFILHELLLHGYSYIPVTELSPVIDIDIHICILLLDMLAFDTRCVIGDTSPTSLVSRFRLSCLMIAI